MNASPQLLTSTKHSRRGAAAVEFALVAVFFFLPLTLGAAVFGMNLVRSIQVTQFNRDACQMYSRGVDFSISGNQAMLLQLAGNLNITATGGKGEVILSTIQCIGAGQAVCTRRIVIGNSGLRSSSFASPTRMDSVGNVDYTNDPAAAANSFLSLLPMNTGDVAYVAETYFQSPDFDIPGFRTNTGVYVRAIF